MKPNRVGLVLPILLITLGVGWLLTALGIVQGIDWVWTLALAALGLLTFVIGGFDKITAVVGPFLIIASCVSLLRQTDRLSVNTEIPILVIVAGTLLLIARIPAIPLPKWVVVEPNASKQRTDT